MTKQIKKLLQPIKKQYNILVVDSTIHSLNNINADAIIITREHLNIIQKLKNNFTTAHIPIILIYNSYFRFCTKTEVRIDDFIHIDDEHILFRIKMNIERSRRDININPLTKLPGNHKIKEKIAQNLTQNSTFIYIDIDNFKFFNDTHGFIAGDKIIQKVAQSIIQTINTYAPDCFLGHIGGDDFIVIVEIEKANIMQSNLIKAFKAIKEVQISMVAIANAGTSPEQIARRLATKQKVKEIIIALCLFLGNCYTTY